MKKYAIYGLTGLLTLLFLGSAAAKWAAPAGVQAQFDKFGLLAWMRPIGVLEILCLIPFLVPRTLLFGTLLLSAYLGGAIVAHLSHAEPPFFPAVVLGLVWLLAYLKEPRLFAAQS
jgi:DoxX-like family